MPSIIISSISASKGKSALAAAIISRLRNDNVTVMSLTDTGGLFASDDGVQTLAAEALAPSNSSVSVIEGSSGDPLADINLAEKLDANVVLLASLDEDVKSAASEYGERLSAVIINKVPRYRDVYADRAVAALNDDGVPCLGWLPEDRRLAANSVDSLMDHLKGQLAFEVNTTSELIDNVLIGGLVLDWGPFYFRSQDNTCVVVRSGRPDVQISALQSETTRAIVLTGGEKPIDYVFYEARTKRIPLIVVDADTDATMDALDELIPEDFSHPEKLARFSQLLVERSMMDPILDIVALSATR